jgi:hypothetical protein
MEELTDPGLALRHPYRKRRHWTGYRNGLGSWGRE